MRNHPLWTLLCLASSLSAVVLRVIPVAATDLLLIPYAFRAACFSVNRPEFVCSFVDGLGCFQLRAIMNKAAMNNLVKYLFFIMTKAENVMHLKPQ